MSDLALWSRGELLPLQSECPRYLRLAPQCHLQRSSVEAAHFYLSQNGSQWTLNCLGSNLLHYQGKAVRQLQLAPDQLIYFHQEAILVVQFPKLPYTQGERKLNPQPTHRPCVLWHNLLMGSHSSYMTLQRISCVSRLEVPVWIQGETGTGKELVASALHYGSSRSRAPFVAINCASLPDQLIESELFGVVRGAYTGATHTRQGAFARAHQGTLFLDEVAELSPAAQAKLLRVLESGELYPVGSERPIRVDVRVICACWRNLEEEARQGRFRQDLLHRLWVLKVILPSLRERPDDILPLVEHFMRQFNAPESLYPSAEVVRLMGECAWEGNIRELRNNILRAIALHEPEQLLSAPAIKGVMKIKRSPQALESTLKHFAGNRSRSARALGISRSTLYRWLAKH